MIMNNFIRFWVCLCLGIYLKITVLGFDNNKPCTWMDGDRQIGSIDGCRYRKAFGRNVLIDFQSAARSLVPSCTCHIQVVDEGFVAFHVLRVPDNDDCKAVVILGSSERKATTRYKCAQRHPTRLVSLEDKALVTLSVNKTGHVKEESNTSFCFRISGNVELYVKCFPDYVSTTSTTPPEMETTKNPAFPETPVMKLTVAIPATLGGVAFVLLLLMSILCIVRRQIKRAKSNGYTSSSELTGTDSEYSGISTIGGGESIRSYDDLMPGDYLSLRDPNRIAKNISEKHNISKGHRDRYSHPVSEEIGQGNRSGPLPVPQNRGVTSDNDTSGYYDDDEHPYDVISEEQIHVYENSGENMNVSDKRTFNNQVQNKS